VPEELTAMYDTALHANEESIALRGGER